MGFRSTFVTNDYHGLIFPEWFVEKYEEYININANCLSSKTEAKEYLTWEYLVEDIKKSLTELNDKRQIVLVWLHECGGIDKVEITSTEVVYIHPIDWEVGDGVSHYYCYGCSDSSKFS